MKTKKTRIRYPWDLWFSSGHFTLREGVDYHCLTFTMNTQVRNAAVKRSLRVSIHHSKDKKADTMTVTVTGRS